MSYVELIEDTELSFKEKPPILTRVRNFDQIAITLGLKVGLV